MTVMRNALCRSDMIVKTPSNDPLTAIAIARTMIDMAPGHPITRHLSVGYWKGGDERIEAKLYQPANVEKIVAWGGLASVQHIAKYIQPGIDLITLDPKLLLADEPTGNLDSATSDAIHDLFFQINKLHGTTIVVVTHNAAFAESMPRVVRMRDGKVETDDVGKNQASRVASSAEAAAAAPTEPSHQQPPVPR